MIKMMLLYAAVIGCMVWMVQDMSGQVKSDTVSTSMKSEPRSMTVASGELHQWDPWIFIPIDYDTDLGALARRVRAERESGPHARGTACSQYFEGDCVKWIVIR